MFIQTEQTPNPETLKFLPGQAVSTYGPLEFRSPEEASVSPLVSALFQIEGVSRVYLGSDFLTVTRSGPDQEWRHLKAPILAAVMDHFTLGHPLLTDDGAQGAETGDAVVYDADTAQIVAEIKDLLDTRIRPAVAQDGGDILFDRFDVSTGTVYLHMRGACSGCPSSSATLKSGVEKMLKHYVPEVVAVEQSL
jgi:Fe-S cluster biogenesis protein NfuA